MSSKTESCHKVRRFRALQTVVAFAVVIAAQVAIACNIPVFRYALERWQPDSIQVVVFQYGKLGKQQQDAIRNSFGVNANIELLPCNISESMDTDLESLWAKVPDDAKSKLPYIVIRTSLRDGTRPVCWNGSIENLPNSGIASSPVRTEITKRLLAGDAIVWLLVKGTDEQQNVSVRKFLQTKLDQLQETIEFPDGLGLPGSELYSEVPLLMQFSILEVDRNDPAENFLMASFGLHQSKGTKQGDNSAVSTVLVPVFGKGRVLDVLEAKRVDDDLIESLTRYLCAACSCQVKEQNPGFDLLLSTDWNLKLFGESGIVPEASDGLRRDQPQAPVLLTIPPGKKR